MSSIAIRGRQDGFVFLALLVATVGMPAAEPVVLHLSPAGSDEDPGTPDRPIRSLGRLRVRLTEKPPVTEVVYFHRGVYGAV